VRRIARSLRTRLFVLFLVAGLTPLLAATVLSVGQASTSLRGNALTAVGDLAFNGSDKIDRNLFERYGDVQAFAKSDPARSMDPARLQAWMDTMMGTYTPIYRLMVVADLHGKIIAANRVDLDGKPLDTASLIGLDASSADWFKTTAGGKLADGVSLVEDLHRDDLLAKVFGSDASEGMSFSYPIKDDAGKIVGVWTNRFNWGVVQSIIDDVTKRSVESGAKTTQLTIVDDKGLVLLDSVPADSLTRNIAQDPAVVAASADGATGSLDGAALDGSGRLQLVGYVHSAGYSIYPGIGWSVLAAQDRSEALAAVSNLTTTALAVGLVAAALVAAIAYVISRSIAGRVARLRAGITSLAEIDAPALESALGAFADNDLSLAIERRTMPLPGLGSDEIGDAATSLNQLIERLGGMIASYDDARRGLSATLVEVRDASKGLTETSARLDLTSRETGAATDQVARTIQQVAAGAADQAQAASTTSLTVAELGEAIATVGSGATDTARRVDEANVTLGSMAGTIREASAASLDVERVSASAAAAAAGGATAVRETVAGMERIKSAVAGASVRVTELGAKGEQIGAIVETINDIAEQTNLLALNAAIEAARAGEMGKGFAVVADEVRKLAERSGRATKEIADLISQVQAGTADAVAAMQVGSDEVSSGGELASRSGAALEAIASSVDETRQAIARIATSIASTDAASARVIEAIDGIASIAALNEQAAGAMTESAGRMTGAVSSIAAVSEENSAAAEEVSAATEEMAAQVQDVVGSAVELTRMAGELDALVARFRLADEATASAAPASRSGAAAVRPERVRPAA
jgi:methyl-accepting chemotaxis protein